jgi:non-ribosomal peptide synthase protein (TIGR01720 family)
MGEVSFNYLGQVSSGTYENPSGIFSLSSDSTGMSQSLLAKRYYLIDVIASIVDEKLFVEWRFSSRIHRRETISVFFEQFVTNIQEMAGYLAAVTTTNYFPSDFEDVDLSQSDIDEILKELNTSSSDGFIEPLDE